MGCSHKPLLSGTNLLICALQHISAWLQIPRPNPQSRYPMRALALLSLFNLLFTRPAPARR
jgi:hypothetical protein